MKFHFRYEYSLWYVFEISFSVLLFHNFTLVKATLLRYKFAFREYLHITYTYILLLDLLLLLWIIFWSFFVLGNTLRKGQNFVFGKKLPKNKERRVCVSNLRLEQVQVDLYRLQFDYLFLTKTSIAQTFTSFSRSSLYLCTSDMYIWLSSFVFLKLFVSFLSFFHARRKLLMFSLQHF